MTDTILDVTHKTAIGGAGFTLSKFFGDLNEGIGVLIAIATLVYFVIKIRNELRKKQ